MSNYYYNLTSKYNDIDTKSILSARRFELLAEDIADEVGRLANLGIDNSSEEFQRATIPPFAYRVALASAQEVLRRETERIVRMLQEEAEEEAEEEAKAAASQPPKID